MSEFNVRTFLMDRFPTDLDERLIYEAGPSAGPLTHAIARSLKLIEFGGCSCEFSTSSASARNAIADALEIASCSVMPYANAPGTSGISAIQRPSTSCSVSMLNRKSWLLVLYGGLRSVVTLVGCSIMDLDAALRRSFFCNVSNLGEAYATFWYSPIKLCQRIQAAVNSLYSGFSE